jgi:thioester reductase-like protein
LSFQTFHLRVGIRKLTRNADNQWQVNFNLSLSSFTPHALGTLSLINLSTSSPNSPRIFFTSSIGTLGNWSLKHGTEQVPETALDDPSIPLAQGYSESKRITKRLLDAAGKKSGVSSAVLRVGQIAGPAEFGTKGG